MEPPLYMFAELSPMDELNAPLNRSARLRYTCMSVSKKYIALGSNTGGAYIFTRDTLKYLQVIFGEVDSSSVDVVSLSQATDNHVAFTASSGQVVVMEMNFEKRLKPERIRLSNDHTGYTVTALQWNKTGNKLFIGDNSGKVTVAHVPLTKASVLFNQPTEMIARLESAIVQIDYNHEKLLVSTLTRCYLFSTQSEREERSITARFIKTRHQYSQIGKKLSNLKKPDWLISSLYWQSDQPIRVLVLDGEFGACFFVEPSSNIPVVYCSRPGSRMWEVDFDGNVLNTHQFKKLLSISSTPVIYYNKTSLVTNYTSTTAVSPSVNFKKMYTIGQYIITWCNTGLYVFDTINVKVILWASDIQDIEDLCVYENSVFIFHSDQSIEHLYLFKLEQCMNQLVTKKHWVLAANTLAHFKPNYLPYLRSKISHQTVKNVILNISKEEHRHLIDILSELIIVQPSIQRPDLEGQDELNHLDRYPNHSETSSLTSLDSAHTSDSGSEMVSQVSYSSEKTNDFKCDGGIPKDLGVASILNSSDLSSDIDDSMISMNLKSDSDAYSELELSNVSVEADDSAVEESLKMISNSSELLDSTPEDVLDASIETTEDLSLYSSDSLPTPKEVEHHEVDHLKEHSDQSLRNSKDFPSDQQTKTSLNNSPNWDNTNQTVVSDLEINGKSVRGLISTEGKEENQSVLYNIQTEKDNSVTNSILVSATNEQENPADFNDTPVAVIPEVDDDIIVKMKSKNRRRKVNEIDLSHSSGLMRSTSVKPKNKKRDLKTKRSVSVPALDNSIILKNRDVEHDTMSLCSMDDIERSSTPYTENHQQYKDSDTVSLNSLEENTSEVVLPLIKRLSMSGITSGLDEQHRETSSSVDSLNTSDSPSGSLSQSPRVTLMAVKDSLALKLKKGKTFIKTMKEKSQLSKSPTVPDNSFTDSMNEEHQIVMSTVDEQVVTAKDDLDKTEDVPKVLPKTDIRNLISATVEAQRKLQDIQIMLNPTLLSQTLKNWVTVLNTTFRNLQTENFACANDNKASNEKMTTTENLNMDEEANVQGVTNVDSSQNTKWPTWCHTSDPFGLDVEFFPQVSELTKLCFQTCCHGNISAFIYPKTKVNSSCDKEYDADALVFAQNKFNDLYENGSHCDNADAIKIKVKQCDRHNDESNCDSHQATILDQTVCNCLSENDSSVNNAQVIDSANTNVKTECHQTTNNSSETIPDTENHSEAPDKGHELQMTSESNSDQLEPQSVNHGDIDTSSEVKCQYPRQLLDQELSVFIRCYFAFLGINVIRQFLNEQEDILFKTWLTLIECCQELGKEDPIKMYIDKQEVNDALDHLRSGILKYKDAFLGHYASIFNMSVYKCIEFGKDVPDKVSPLDILNLCHHYNKPTNQYLLKYIMMRHKEATEFNRPKVLHSICEHPEVKLEVLKCLLTRKDDLKLDKPSPGSHLVKWTHQKMINDVLDMINDKHEQIKALKICEEQGYWLGYLRLIDSDEKWKDVIKLICCLGDIQLLCADNDFGYTPKSTEEWKYLLQEVLSLESAGDSKTSMVPVVPDFTPSITLENTASLLVDCLGSLVASQLLQELNLEDKRLSNEFYQKCILKAITQARQGVVMHNMLEKLNTYLWSKKPQNMAPQIHYAVSGEKSALKSSDNPATSSSYQTHFSRLSGRVIHPGLEDAECHWGIQTQINSECSNCNQYLFTTVSHMEPGALIFQCGHAFHKFCVSRPECPLC